MNKPETTIIIRTRNEEHWVGRVLEKLFRQSYKDFEVIIIDSGSTDKTLAIVSKFPVKIIEIKSEEFSYPRALNMGIRESSAEKYIVILSAHSLPVSDQWLEFGIDRLHKNEKAMGVFGPVKAMPDGTFWDRFFTLARLRELILCFPKRYRVIVVGGMGVLGFTNAIIRKDLWASHNFDEGYGSGGEDGEWANYWLSRGYSVIKDINFTVHHSHYLNFSQWLQQFKYWADSSRPRPFKYLKFRKDSTHK